MGSANPRANAESEANHAGESEHSVAPAESARVERLEQENKELLRMSRYRSVFLSRIAHELRTPLTSIMGFSEILLSQEKLTDAQRGFCERIQSSAHQLQNSLNQLSDLSRLEAGQTQLACEDFSFAETLRDSVAAVARRAQKKRVTVNLSVDDKLTAVTSDRGRLRQVIYNALAYAITRSPEQHSVDVIGEIKNGVAEMVVRDHGEPLKDPNEIGMLDAENDKAGTGELGLAIARQNIEILSGTISAANTDAGLELKIALPVKPAPKSSTE